MLRTDYCILVRFIANAMYVEQLLLLSATFRQHDIVATLVDAIFNMC